VITQDQDIKLVTGHVGNGNMRIDEFTNRDEMQLPFDVVDDALVFMRNDPQFYRKNYFPVTANMADTVRAGKDIDRKQIGSMVDSGINSYCKKYNIARKPADVFTLEDREAIIEKICSEELKEIEGGSY
jgi:hypothetical protein